VAYDQDADLDEDVTMDDAMGENYGSKTIVIDIGSQNLRLGLATDALPKTVPMVIARKAPRTETEDCEPRPKRLKLDEDAAAEELFGEEVRCVLLTSLANADFFAVRERVQQHGCGLQDITKSEQASSTAELS